ncbi:hypothetical protein CTAYLR_009137 [Chrysophaeum taylorii]|uniref:Sulfate transporter n=1 Tax=Chrysophaeum taylorii TaxID=2483200 RepID=A0AAD7XT09_9STRA|nr:hypothetical protein CTAYLR_009137 [Chrysophaeum taylorii]
MAAKAPADQEEEEEVCRGVVEFLRRRHSSFWTRMTAMEASGMMGDLGTLLPLTLAMAEKGSIRPGAALLWTGVFNVIGAYQWDLPMPVQPMKTIAATAITEGLSEGAVAAAGIFTGGAVALLGLTGVIEIVNRVVPRSVVSGIQLGLGLRMVGVGVAYVGARWTALDGPFLGGAAALAGAAAAQDLPVALLIVLVGAAVAAGQWLATNDAARYAPYALGVAPRQPTSSDWAAGILRAGLPQLPLTTLNSVISVCALSERLFPDREKATRRSVSTSVGAMNLIGCFFGAMPSCHGAGGLSGQYKFGARGGAAIFMFGFLKIAIVLALGETNLRNAIAAFPRSLLGALLALAGAELARAGAKADGAETATLATAGVTIGLSNTGAGAAVGLLVAYSELLCEKLKARRSPTTREIPMHEPISCSC